MKKQKAQNFLALRKRGDGLLVAQLLQERGTPVAAWTISDILVGKKPNHPDAANVLSALAEVIANRQKATEVLIAKAHRTYETIINQ